MTSPALGVCYYPEHWPEEMWERDAARMAEVGIVWVRIGEFAWSKLEPTPGQLTFEWIIRAMDVLGRHGLKVVFGTPTATPPRWQVGARVLARAVTMISAILAIARKPAVSRACWRKRSATIRRWPPGRPTMNMAATAPPIPIRLRPKKVSSTGWPRNMARWTY